MKRPEFEGIDFQDISSLRPEILDTFEYVGERQLIEYSTNEFSAVCPYSGLPDIGTLIIHYIPRNKCLELKSLKYYILSYRQVGIYQEHATNELFNHIFKSLEPQYLKIKTIYNTRGGIDTLCEIEKGSR